MHAALLGAAFAPDHDGHHAVGIDAAAEGVADLLQRHGFDLRR